MISPIKSIRQRIRDNNVYKPKFPRKAMRKYIPGTRQTVKKPGDIVIDEKGNTRYIN